MSPADRELRKSIGLILDVMDRAVGFSADSSPHTEVVRSSVRHATQCLDLRRLRCRSRVSEDPRRQMERARTAWDLVWDNLRRNVRPEKRDEVNAETRNALNHLDVILAPIGAAFEKAKIEARAKKRADAKAARKAERDKKKADAKAAHQAAKPAKPKPIKKAASAASKPAKTSAAPVPTPAPPAPARRRHLHAVS